MEDLRVDAVAIWPVDLPDMWLEWGRSEVHSQRQQPKGAALMPIARVFMQAAKLALVETSRQSGLVHRPRTPMIVQSASMSRCTVTGAGRVLGTEHT